MTVESVVATYKFFSAKPVKPAQYYLYVCSFFYRIWSYVKVYSLGSLNHAHAKIAYPAWAARVAREKARDNARAVAVI